MPIQRSEDPARNLHAIWHGPTNAWRWPFDATYTEWSVAAATFVASAIILWWAAPLGLVFVLLALGIGRMFARRIDRGTLARVLRTDPKDAEGTRRRTRRVATGAALLMVLAAVPNPTAWLLPSPWWLALPGALYVAVRVVRWARPWIDGNRPVPYWISTLRAIPRRPARLQRDPAVIGFAGVPTVPDQPLDDAVLDFLSDVALIDPEEVNVPLYRERTPTVEAMLWDSTTGRVETCENIIAVLRAREIPHRIPQVVRREVRQPGGTYVSVRERVALEVDGTPVPDGTVITLDAERRVAFVARTEFSRRFEMVLPRPEHQTAPVEGAL
jgi:hypothetical protein